jgi:hypothetical protein
MQHAAGGRVSALNPFSNSHGWLPSASDCSVALKTSSGQYPPIVCGCYRAGRSLRSRAAASDLSNSGDPGRAIPLLSKARTTSTHLVNSSHQTAEVSAQLLKQISEYFTVTIPEGSVIRVSSSVPIATTSITGSMAGDTLRSTPGLR